MSILFVCLYMFKCDVCAQPYVDQIKKIFVLFTCFWKRFVSSMFFKVFQVNFVWKTCFLGVFVTYFLSKLSCEFKWSNSQVFQLWIESFVSVLWDIYFKLLPSSPKLLFLCFYIKTPLNSIVFHSINISKVLFNSFEGFMFIVGIFSNGGWKT